MKVYVAVQGVYSGQNVAGVYDSPERAIGDLHKEGWVWTRQDNRQRWVNGRTFTSWRNDQDWDHAIQIDPIELKTEGPLRAPDKAEVVTDSEDGLRVIYTPEPV